MELRSEGDTIAFGRSIAGQLKPQAVVALYGDLGTGKTTLAKGMISALTGFETREIQSPTFTYMNLYDGNPPLYHFDLYRLDGMERFLEMGFLDFLEGDGITLIEWPERITPLLPKETLKIHLKHTEEGRRADVQNS